MSHHITWEQKGLYRVFTNKVCGKEVLNSNLVCHGDARFDDIKYVINDFMQVTEFEVSDDDINIISAVDNVATMINASLKIAIVVSLETLRAWAQMYCDKMQNSVYQCRIFDNVADARKWVSCGYNSLQSG